MPAHAHLSVCLFCASLLPPLRWLRGGLLLAVLVLRLVLQLVLHAPGLCGHLRRRSEAAAACLGSCRLPAQPWLRSLLY